MTIIAVLAAVLIGAPSPQSSSTGSTPKTPVTLDGCVVANPNDRKAFTLDDDGRTYLLKGLNVRDFVGQHVEVIGAAGKRLRIVGGLYPSPNVAAQAGGIDPTKAAMAAQSGPMSQSARPMIEFTVKSVRVLPGSCEAR